MPNITGTNGGNDVISVIGDVGTLNGSDQGSPIGDIFLQATFNNVTIENSSIGTVLGNNTNVNLTTTNSAVESISSGSSPIDLNLTSTTITNGIAFSGPADIVMTGGGFSGGDSAVTASFSGVNITDPSFAVGNGNNSLSFDAVTFADNLNLTMENGGNVVEISGNTVFGSNSSISAAFGSDQLIVPDGSVITTGGTDYVVGTDPLPSGFGLNGTVTLPNTSTFSFSGFDSFSASGPVCFAEDTEVLTDCGYRRVQDLKVGDRLIDAMGNRVALLWSGASEIVFCPDNDKHKPIVFKPGSLGVNAPSSTLVVSPSHRILMTLAEEEGGDVLCPAKSLLHLPGVRVRRGAKRVIYYALLLERHSVIVANNSLCESFFPGPWARVSMEHRLQVELSSVLAQLGGSYGRQSRPCLTVQAASKRLRPPTPPKVPLLLQQGVAPTAKRSGAVTDAGIQNVVKRHHPDQELRAL